MSTWESMCLHLFESSQGHQFIHSFRTATCRTKSTGSLERLFSETSLQRIFFVHPVFFQPLVSFISSHSSAGSIAELTDGPVSSFAFGWPRGWYQLCKGGFRFPAFSDSLSISSNPGKRCRASSTGPLDGACRHMAKSRSGWASRLAKEIIFKIRKKSSGNALKLKPMLNALYFVTCLCWPWTRFHRFHVLLQILFGPPPRGWKLGLLARFFYMILSWSFIEGSLNRNFRQYGELKTRCIAQQ